MYRSAFIALLLLAIVFVDLLAAASQEGSNSTSYEGNAKNPPRTPTKRVRQKGSRVKAPHISPDIDVKRLTSQREYVVKTKDCMVNKGPCDNVQRRIKEIANEITQKYECTTCTKFESDSVSDLTRLMSNRYPKIFDEVINFYAGPDADRAAISGVLGVKIN